MGKGSSFMLPYQLRAELHFTGPPPCTDLVHRAFCKKAVPFNGKSETLNVLESNGLAKLGSEYSDCLDTSTRG